MSPGWSYLRSVLTALTLLALGLVAFVTVGSQFQGARDQRVEPGSTRQIREC
jgi:hypothetical protein